MTYARSFFSVLLVVVLTLPTQAQSQSIPPMWKQAFGYQMAELLESPDLNVQETALKNIIVMANQGDRDITLQPAERALVKTYETSPIRAHRMMAIAALHKIDSADAYFRLLRSGLRETDAGIRLMILHAAASSRSIKRSPVADAYNRLLKVNTTGVALTSL